MELSEGRRHSERPWAHTLSTLSLPRGRIQPRAGLGLGPTPEEAGRGGWTAGGGGWSPRRAPRRTASDAGVGWGVGRGERGILPERGPLGDPVASPAGTVSEAVENPPAEESLRPPRGALSEAQRWGKSGLWAQTAGPGPPPTPLPRTPFFPRIKRAGVEAQGFQRPEGSRAAPHSHPGARRPRARPRPAPRSARTSPPGGAAGLLAAAELPRRRRCPLPSAR